MNQAISSGMGSPGKRRPFELGEGSGGGAAQVIAGVGMAAGKARAAQLEDSLHLGQRRSAAQQLLGDPLVGDTPIGLGISLWNPQPVQPSLIDGCGGVGGERAIGRAEASRSRRAGAQPVLGRIYQRSAVSPSQLGHAGV